MKRSEEKISEFEDGIAEVIHEQQRESKLQK
jgi:hypothetical protein